MKKINLLAVIGLLLVGAFLLAACGGSSQSNTLKIGILAEITGEVPKVGEAGTNTVNMYVEEVNEAGGIDVGGKKYLIELVTEDCTTAPEGAASSASKVIEQDKVLAIVGPNRSMGAIPGGEIANTAGVVLISPWSTNPRTTAGRPYVFRAPFLDTFQGVVDAQFATDELGATKAAILYDIACDYCKGIAEYFQAEFDSIHGAGAVVAVETFTTGDQDFSAQLTTIKGAGAEVLFTPQFYNEVPLIVSQAHDLGLDIKIMGSDSWGDPQTLELCGELCNGLYFTTHYVASAATGATKEFVDKYEALHGEGTASDVAALGWDSIDLVVKAIQNCGEITGDLTKDRTCIKDGMAAVKDFAGITGTMSFDSEGDPIKCVAIVKIEDQKFVQYGEVCP
jgi:branched-chain amino acid transport system substrate-binding protein